MNSFEITEAHLILLSKMYVETIDDNNTPAIDSKRPYGNSDYLEDICGILGFERDGDGFGSYYSEEQQMLAEKLHEETATALQICLVLQRFETGKYIKTEQYNKLSWEKFDPTSYEADEWGF